MVGFLIQHEENLKSHTVLGCPKSESVIGLFAHILSENIVTQLHPYHATFRSHIVGKVKRSVTAKEGAE